MNRLPAAAAAIIATALVTAPTAPARPDFPLAPACDAFKLPSFTNFVAGSRIVTIGFAPDGKSGRANTGGYGSQDSSFGDVTGGLNGRHAEFLVHWDQGPEGGNKWQYSGDVGDDLGLAGTLRAPGVTEAWHSEVPVECVAPKPDASPAASQKTATVLQAVDVYNQPDGTGTVYRDAAGQKIFLPVGRQVQLVKPCRENWCQVVDPDVPGDAWVYQTPFLQMP
ncbi:MAG TPA: hypothetical protein VFB19_16105 [Mycobacterium sp.]|nr:hypothetical protein [Mycobacterium sp.]